MPVLAIMCKSSMERSGHSALHVLTIITDLFNALDKGNLGNAESAGLSKSMLDRLCPTFLLDTLTF
jgi:hypothetical protein